MFDAHWSPYICLTHASFHTHGPVACTTKISVQSCITMQLLHIHTFMQNHTKGGTFPENRKKSSDLIKR